MRAFVATIGLLLSGAAWSYFDPPLLPQEAELVSVVEGLRAEGARSREAFRLLPCDIAYASGPRDCYSQRVRVGDLTIEEVHFRWQQRGGAIIELRGVGPACIRLEAIQSRFRGGSIGNRCFDSICRYYSIDGSSGRLSFGLPASGQAPQCVTSVVLNFEN